MMTLSHCLYLLVFLSLLHFSLSTFAFCPVDQYLINCGSTEPTTFDPDRREFTGDSSEAGSRFLFSSQAIRLRDPNPPPGSSPILNTARVFTTPSRYAFQIREKGTHLVRLHFRQFDSKINVSSAQFHVSANGHVLLYNLFIGSFSQTPRVKDYMIWIDVEELVISFTPSKISKFAFINAIEVISAPKDLIADVATLVKAQKIEKIDGLMKNSLETVYRVNVGGPKVTPFNDSLWRTWVPDDEYLKTSNGSKMIHFGGRIKYRAGGASREVGPDNVYNTARVISNSSESIPESNILWEFPVVRGYNYLVRMHFCDIGSVSLGLIYFNVYVNGNLAYENLDLSDATNWVLASPFYADFIVDGGESSGVLSVSVGPSNRSMLQAIDGILNGVEIMKMNNSMGSLDGEVCVELILRSSGRSSGGGCMVPLVAALCLLVIASLVMHRRWDRIKNSLEWTPLPLSEVDLKSRVQSSLGKA